LRYIGVIGGTLGKKVKTSIALDRDLIDWIDEMTRTKRFANRTHAIEFAIQKLRESGFS
jgi:Arc/MetJ-type ribon-helix-helix transcriptional regulator